MEEKLSGRSQLIVQFLFRAGSTVDTKLVIGVRAKGITGEFRSTQTEPSNKINFLIIFAAMLTAMMSMFLMVIAGNKSQPYDSPQKPAMFILYSKYGFQEFANQLLQKSGGDVTFIMESVALTKSAILQPPEKIRAAINLQNEMMRNNNRLHPSSSVIIKINIASLYLKINDENQAKAMLSGLGKPHDYLTRLKIESDEQIKKMLEQT